ncbi:MAG: TA0956 family protein [Thermoplasmataceae archaeon]
MYNITVGERHPAVICVELSNVSRSLLALAEVLSSEYMEEELQEFIENFSRTDEVMPEDRTVGFVVVNSTKRILSLSFSSISNDMANNLRAQAESFRKIGYEVQLDIE